MLLCWLLRLLFLLSICIIVVSSYAKPLRKTYIVYMGDHPKGINPSSLPSLHAAMAQNVLRSDFSPEVILHSYWKSFNGFAMKLTEEEAKTIAGMKDVVSIFPSKKKKGHTTRSWDFIGFPQKVERRALESDIIVGVLDSGIWPNSESFSDQGFGPPPAKWKGSCQNITCNNKLIGARYYRASRKFYKGDIISPVDQVSGHGTHTASTAAGNLVPSASLLGLGFGTARGGVPSARIAVYKVCWGPNINCDDADILAGFDDAIADGVDIISFSVGGSGPIEYFVDSTSIAAFHAMKRNILVSNSAGNEGPGLYTISTLAPWLLSVAASTIDRKFYTNLHLGNGLVFKGISVNTFDLKDKYYPLIHGQDAPNVRAGHNASESRYCEPNSLDKKLVKGKIVVCDDFFADFGVSSEVVGAIHSTLEFKDKADTYALPTIDVGYEDGIRIRSYINSARNPTATISRSDEEKDLFAPYVASFSSRGPDPFAPYMLKPDISAPGVDILAAWPAPLLTPSLKIEKRDRNFNIESGTSMACPHATGAAAYVKSFHPNWSPSAIKSALMTTAIPLSPSLNPDAELAYGAGQINPTKATNPGLVYDAKEIDYVKFLCGQAHYDKKKLQLITKNHRSSCAQFKNETYWDLNLPSFAYRVHDKSMPFHHSSFRTVTNVGSSKSTYKAKIIAPSLLNIQVVPEILRFTYAGQKKSFILNVEGKTNMEILSASLIWDDGTFQVRSPIVVYGIAS